MIDFDALALGPIYDAFGEPAVLTLGAASYDLTVIDHTQGVEVEDSGVGVQTIRAAMDLRRSALQTREAPRGRGWASMPLSWPDYSGRRLRGELPRGAPGMDKPRGAPLH